MLHICILLDKYPCSLFGDLDLEAPRMAISAGKGYPTQGPLRLSSAIWRIELKVRQYDSVTKSAISLS